MISSLMMETQATVYISEVSYKNGCIKFFVHANRTIAAFRRIYVKREEIAMFLKQYAHFRVVDALDLRLEHIIYYIEHNVSKWQ